MTKETCSKTTLTTAGEQMTTKGATQRVEVHVTAAGSGAYDTDQDMYLVQGWTIQDPDTLSQLSLPDGETAVIVPKALMKHLPEEEHGAADA
jgi:hypothetical protein